MATAPKSKAKVNKNNTTGFHGVTKNAKGLFVAQINHNRKTKRIGTFKKAIDAAKAYDAEAVIVHGDRAKLNFPPKVSKAVKAE